MYQCLETIKLIDGVFHKLDLHQQRIDRAFAALFPILQPIDIEHILKNSNFPTVGLYKCRLLYGSMANHSYELQFELYVRREISSLQLITANIQQHPYKLCDRSDYNHAFAQRQHCDDVLIVSNGWLTDTSYCNIALWDGKKWYTPALPLLKGVHRAALLQAGIIHEKNIAPHELRTFSSIRLFNAMIEFGEIEINTDKIKS